MTAPVPGRAKAGSHRLTAAERCTAEVWRDWTRFPCSRKAKRNGLCEQHAQQSERPRRKPTRAKGLGISEADYAALLDRQGGGCAICGSTPKARRLHVDHDHKTGCVRGLLCMRCNRALPEWVTAEWLTRAALYLAPEYSYENGPLRSAVIALYEATV